MSYYGVCWKCGRKRKDGLFAHDCEKAKKQREANAAWKKNRESKVE